MSLSLSFSLSTNMSLSVKLEKSKRWNQWTMGTSPNVRHHDKVTTLRNIYIHVTYALANRSTLPNNNILSVFKKSNYFLKKYYKSFIYFIS